MPRVIHFEMYADDPEKVREFYEDVFEWKFKKWEGPQEYWNVVTGAAGEPGINGGLVRRREGLDARTVNTIAVSSLDQCIEKIQQRGGKITVPRMAIQGVGWLVFAQDPEGSVFGMLEADTTAK